MTTLWNRTARPSGLSAILFQGLAWLVIVLMALPLGTAGSWSASLVSRTLSHPSPVESCPDGEEDDDDGDADRSQERAARDHFRFRRQQKVRSTSPAWLSHCIHSHSSTTTSSIGLPTPYASGQ